MKESGFKKKFKRDLEEKGFFTYSTYDTIHKGVPDVFCLRRGESYWIELKYIDSPSRLSHPLTASQAIFLTDINQHGGHGMVVIGVGKMYHVELISEYGERNSFEFNLMEFDQVVEWMSKLQTDTVSLGVFEI